jgi:hypothetical protein
VLAMARRFYPSPAARLSPRPGGQFLPPLIGQTLRLRQRDTMWQGYSRRRGNLRRGAACVN